MKYIRKIRQNKAEGQDEMHARLLRECEMEILLPLAIFFPNHLLKVKCDYNGKEQMLCPFSRFSRLFIIFVNTVEKGIDSKVLKFADDVKVHRTVESG